MGLGRNDRSVFRLERNGTQLHLSGHYSGDDQCRLSTTFGRVHLEGVQSENFFRGVTQTASSCRIRVQDRTLVVEDEHEVVQGIEHRLEVLFALPQRVLRGDPRQSAGDLARHSLDSAAYDRRDLVEGT